MNKNELVEQVAGRAGLSRGQAAGAVEAALANEAYDAGERQTGAAAANQALRAGRRYGNLRVT